MYKCRDCGYAYLHTCHTGRSRSKRALHKAPTRQFLLYLKKAAETLVDDEANEHDFDGCNVTEIVQRWLQVLCGSDFIQHQVHQMLTKHHAKGLKFTKLDGKLKFFLNEGLLVSPTECELHVLIMTVPLQDSKGKINISLGDILKDERAENSRLRLRIRELEGIDAKAAAAHERAAAQVQGRGGCCSGRDVHVHSRGGHACSCGC